MFSLCGRPFTAEKTAFCDVKTSRNAAEIRRNRWQQENLSDAKPLQQQQINLSIKNLPLLDQPLPPEVYRYSATEEDETDPNQMKPNQPQMPNVCAAFI